MSPYREPAPIDIHVDPLPARHRFMRPSIGRVIAGAAIFVVATRIIAMVAGCAPAVGPEAAGAGYAAQQLACVDTYADRHNIDACRAKVRAAWGIDAGPEGGW